jgi:hypothetical protein
MTCHHHALAGDHRRVSPQSSQQTARPYESADVELGIWHKKDELFYRPSVRSPLKIYPESCLNSAAASAGFGRSSRYLHYVDLTIIRLAGPVLN